ncbi:DEAD/DEAH box helicase [Foetidibacter luteolus]|uniref:DEAD/DEAH box helicase n=1 Tax=Foetidibacter luteolus TaxID=2608880 RepID=UPI001F38ED20|nr:DEAD/DEAH box helicase [Foetidibacter luteolus]
MSKANSKAALLLYPQNLLRGKPPLAILEIEKKNKTIEYFERDADTAVLTTLFPALPRPAKEALAMLGKKGFDKLKFQIKDQFSKLQTSNDYIVYYNKTLQRFLHEAFDQLKPFANLVKWYSKIEVGKKFLLTPCSFSSFKPQLSFEVLAENGQGLHLETNLLLNGNSYRLSTFNRISFLLEGSNEYFIPGFKDFNTLEWLQQSNPAQYAHNAAALAKNILAVLEADYTVKRNNLFEQNQVAALPTSRVMLSELNNTFLMLTPQWVYDGFLVEGPFKEQEQIIRNGETYAVKRHKETEDQLLQLLVSLYPTFEKQRNGYYYLSFADAQKKQWFLKTYHKLLDLDIEIAGMDMLRHFRYSPFKVETSINIVGEKEESIMMEMQVSFGKETVPLNELQKNLLAGARAVLLKDDSLGILDDEWLHRYSALVKHGKVNKKEIAVPRWLAITEHKTPEEQRVLTQTIQQEWWTKWSRWQHSDKEVYPLPANVQATLRPYQQKGYEWIRLLAEAGAGACLADDMGLGKTLQAICFLAHYAEKHPQSKSIVVCPASLIYNWQQEVEKFAPAVKAVVYHGNARSKEEWQQPGVQLVITTYGTMRSDADLLCETFYGVAVIDESHNIKNPSALITRAVVRLNAHTRIALSGTPVVNNTFDLYAQLSFVAPGLFGSREFFKREYADPIDKNADEEKVAALKKLTDPFVLRRTKQQVAKDLPERTETILWCDMYLKQRELYNEIKDQVRNNVFLEIQNSGFSKSKLAVLDGMLKLRQVCNSPLLLKGYEHDVRSSIKTTVLMEELANILTSHKALVFSQFSSMLDLLAAECRKTGLPFYHFDGQTPPAQRAEMVNAFQEPGNTTNLFLISLKAGNTGLTLTAADYVFIFDPWWNTAVQDQAIDRTHRIGQTKNVFAYKMICKDSIEEKIIKMQSRKKKLSEDLVSAEEGFVKSLTEEDVEYLFS